MFTNDGTGNVCNPVKCTMFFIVFWRVCVRGCQRKLCADSSRNKGAIVGLRVHATLGNFASKFTKLLPLNPRSKPAAPTASTQHSDLSPNILV